MTGEDFKNAVLSWNREEKRGGEKDKEIALILSAYEALMNERHLCDLNGLYDAALDVLQDPGAILPWEKLYFSEFNELTGLQMALVKALGKRVSISFGLFMMSRDLIYRKQRENSKKISWEMGMKR
ncbi:MAG: hypothetical protein ACLVLA_14045 [Acidaminococcus intestini]